jgi:hypothetical protein
VTGCSRALTREDERGKKGGHSSDGAPFISGRGGAGDGSWTAPRGGERWGASEAVGQWGVASSSLTAVLMGCACEKHATGAKTGERRR